MFWFNLTEITVIIGIIAKSLEMAQVSVTISDETEKLLEEMAQATGLTKSSLASEILRQGLYREAANLATVANFREKFTPSPPSKGKRRGKAGGEEAGE